MFYGWAGDDPSYRAAARSRYTAATGIFLSATLAAPLLERRARFSYNPLTGSAIRELSATGTPATARPTQLFVYRPRHAKGPPT